MQCGAPATAEIAKSYSTDSVHLLPPIGPEAGFIGCLLFPLWLLMALLKLISWSTARTMSVRTPLCHKHAYGWFTWSTLEAKAIEEGSIVLTGVSQEFADAWGKQRGRGQAGGGGLVRVRCRGCQALNEETARFCNQCGAAI
jgi:hypothetical protein